MAAQGPQLAIFRLGCRPVLTRWSTISDHKCPKRVITSIGTRSKYEPFAFLADLDYYYLRPVGLITFTEVGLFFFTIQQLFIKLFIFKLSRQAAAG